MICKRHKYFGYVLRKDQMSSLYWYTSSESYRNLNAFQRENNFKKWKYFDMILNNAINLLSPNNSPY